MTKPKLDKAQKKRLREILERAFGSAWESKAVGDVVNDLAEELAREREKFRQSKLFEKWENTLFLLDAMATAKEISKKTYLKIVKSLTKQK